MFTDKPEIIGFGHEESLEQNAFSSQKTDTAQPGSALYLKLWVLLSGLLIPIVATATPILLILGVGQIFHLLANHATPDQVNLLISLAAWLDSQDLAGLVIILMALLTVFLYINDAVSKVLCVILRFIGWSPLTVKRVGSRLVKQVAFFNMLCLLVVSQVLRVIPMNDWIALATVSFVGGLALFSYIFSIQAEFKRINESLK